MKNMIIFDLDGTLWDTAEATYKIVNDYLKENGYSFEVSQDVIIENMGFEFDVCAEHYFPKLDKKEALMLLDKIYEKEAELLNQGFVIGKVYPGVTETIKKLSKKYNICIVSNCSNDFYIESFLKTADVSSYVVDYIAASNFFISKAEAIRKIKKKYMAEKAIYVGDTLKDQVSAADAGCQFVCVRYGFGDGVVSKYSIKNIEELIGLASYVFEE